MVHSLLKALAESDLLDSTHLHIFQSFGIDTSAIKPSSNPMNHQGIDEFYKAISKLEYLDINTIMTIAEEYLENVVAPNYYDGMLSAYDILRYKLMLGDTNKFLVIYGSLTGIQKYLYDVKSSQALKQLRGRSFYLYLLLDAIVERIVREFGITRQSVLYSTGGTFCVLLPYKEGVADKFRQFKNNVIETIFNSYRQNIVLLNSVEASLKDLNDNLSEVFSVLHKQKNKEKYIPLYEKVQKMYDDYFVPYIWSKENDIDSYAVNLGNVLGKMRYILVTSREMEIEALDVIEPCGLGVKYYLLSSDNVRHIKEYQESSSLIVYNDSELVNLPISSRREFFAGLGGKSQSFIDLFDDMDDSGTRRLGVLRMDVDNLGNTLRKCCTYTNSLAHYAKMSRKLDVFFKQELNKIWYSKYKDSSVIVYSGGDDLFIVGDWSKIIKFAYEIDVCYKSFFEEKTLSISGGISLVDEKFPIIRAAEYSADEESNAKKFKYVDAKGINYQKNAFSIFGISLRWSVEWSIINDIYDKLCNLIYERENVYHPLLRRILKYYEIVDFKDKQITPLRQVWLMSYDLNRVINRFGNSISRDDMEFITKCKNDIIVGNTMYGRSIDSPYHSLQLWAIVARLVELSTRKNNI